MLLHDEYIQSAGSDMLSVRCSTLSKIKNSQYTFQWDSVCHLGSMTDHVFTLRDCGGWRLLQRLRDDAYTYYTAELLPQRRLMSLQCTDDTQCSVTYDVCTNSKHIGWGCCSF